MVLVFKSFIQPDECIFTDNTTILYQSSQLYYNLKYLLWQCITNVAYKKALTMPSSQVADRGMLYKYTVYVRNKIPHLNQNDSTEIH